MLKLLEPTTKLSLDRLTRRLLLPPLDSNKQKVGRPYRASIRSSKIFFSSISVRWKLITGTLAITFITYLV
jgi:hypothetical protein